MRKGLPVLAIWGCLALAGTVSLVWEADRLAILISLVGLLIVIISSPMFRDISKNRGKAGARLADRSPVEAPGITNVETIDTLPRPDTAGPALGRAMLGVSGPGAGRRQATVLKDKSYLLRCDRGSRG